MGNANEEINLSILRNGICVIPLILQFYKKSDSSIGVHVASPHSSTEETREKDNFKHHKETEPRTNLSDGERIFRNTERRDSEVSYCRSSSRNIRRRSRYEENPEKESSEIRRSSLGDKKTHIRNTNIEEGQLENRFSPREFQIKPKKMESQDMEIIECQFCSRDSIINGEPNNTFEKDLNYSRSNSRDMKRKSGNPESCERDPVEWKFSSNQSSYTSKRSRNVESDLFKHLSILREIQRKSGTEESLQSRSNFKDLKKSSACLEKEFLDCQFSVSDSLRIVKNEKSRENELYKHSVFKDAKMNNVNSDSFESEFFGSQFSSSESARMDNNEKSRDKDLLEKQSNSRDLKKKVRHSEEENELLENKNSGKNLGYTKSEEREILEILACFSALQDKNISEKDLNDTKSNSKQKSLQDHHNESSYCQNKSKNLKINSKSQKSLQNPEPINPSTTIGLNNRPKIDDNHEIQASTLDERIIATGANDSQDTSILMNIDSTNISQEEMCVKKGVKRETLGHRSSSGENNREPRIEESHGKERSPQQTNTRNPRRIPESEESNCYDDDRATYLHRKTGREYGRMKSDPIPIWEKYGIRLEICSTKFFNYSNEAGISVHPYAKPDVTEQDGSLLDEHDSFYFTTRSLLILFQLMGIMPIMRVPKEEQTRCRTTFKWISTATFWAYFIWGLESIIVVMVGKDRLALFLRNSDKRFDEIIYNIIFLSILIPHFLLPVASWRHGPQVAIFKNMWTHYQLKYFRITGEPIVFPNLYVMTWGLCVFCWTFSTVIIISQYYLQPDFALWHTFAYYHIIAMLNGFCSLWYINCNAFGTASKGLARNLHKALQSDHPSKKLAEYRHLWVDLSHMMQQLGRAYSNMYGIYCLVIFFTTIISLYGSLSEILEHGLSYKEIGLFVLGGYCMGLLFIICNEAYHASMKVGLEFQERLLNVNLSVVDHSTQREVEMFLVAISKNPPIMNLDGYTNINRELFTTNISFIATYLVVLMQFKLTLLRQACKGNKTAFIPGNVTTIIDIAD